MQAWQFVIEVYSASAHSPAEPGDHLVGSEHAQVVHAAAGRSFEEVGRRNVAIGTAEDTAQEVATTGQALQVAEYVVVVEALLQTCSIPEP